MSQSGCQKFNTKLQETKSNPGSRVWIRARNEEGLNRKISGVYGLVKTLRLERGSSHVRCLIDYTSSFSPSDENIFSDPKYQKLLETDLMFNVRYDSNGWGSFVSFDDSTKTI